MSDNQTTDATNQRDVRAEAPSQTGRSAARAACCDTVRQATCCAPTAKAGCCAAPASGSCGCA